MLSFRSYVKKNLSLIGKEKNYILFLFIAEPIHSFFIILQVNKILSLGGNI